MKKDLDEVRERMLRAVSQTDAHEYMKHILTENVSHPGKLLRPLLVLSAAGDYQKEAREELLCAAAAAELLHMASLIHDDMIDGAAFRRGRPSVQAEYGLPSALCAGDYLMIRSFSFLNDLGYHVSAGELMKTALQVCDGELMQDMNQFHTTVSEDDYLLSIRRKTASVFAACCATGCRIAGRPEHICKSLELFGEALGMAFQIRDDILDWTSDSSSLQKPAGEDFKNGIYTLPAIYTFANEPGGTALRRYAGGGELSCGDLEKVRAIVTESGGIAYARKVMNQYAEKARGVLESMPKDECGHIFGQLTDTFCL